MRGLQPEFDGRFAAAHGEAAFSFRRTFLDPLPNRREKSIRQRSSCAVGFPQRTRKCGFVLLVPSLIKHATVTPPKHSPLIRRHIRLFVSAACWECWSHGVVERPNAPKLLVPSLLGESEYGSHAATKHNPIRTPSASRGHPSVLDGSRAASGFRLINFTKVNAAPAKST
jgi:hypothetical protein